MNICFYEEIIENLAKLFLKLSLVINYCTINYEIAQKFQ